MLAHIDVIVDQTAAQREVDGMGKLADPTYDPVVWVRSQTDMQALVAKNSRLQAQLEIVDSMSASKVTELESKIKSLEQKVAALELDKRMSAAMVNA